MVYFAAMWALSVITCDLIDRVFGICGITVAAMTMAVLLSHKTAMEMAMDAARWMANARVKSKLEAIINEPKG